MTTLTTASLSTEILEGTLPTLEQITTSITALALNASGNPEQAQRVRELLEDLLADIQDCEEQLGTYALWMPDPLRFTAMPQTRNGCASNPGAGHRCSPCTEHCPSASLNRSYVSGAC